MSLLSSMVDVSELLPQNKYILSASFYKYILCASFYDNFKKRVIRVPEDKARTVLCQKVQKRTPKSGGQNFRSFRRKCELFSGHFLNRAQKVRK